MPKFRDAAKDAIGSARGGSTHDDRAFDRPRRRRADRASARRLSVPTIASILTYSLQARWLGELVAGRHRLPDAAAMAREIAAIKAWKRRWMPASAARGARLLLHMLHYHDELLRDLGLNPKRKTGWLAPLKELIFPYQPSDYRTVVTSELQERGGRAADKGA